MLLLLGVGAGSRNGAWQGGRRYSQIEQSQRLAVIMATKSPVRIAHWALKSVVKQLNLVHDERCAQLDALSNFLGAHLDALDMLKGVADIFIINKA